MVDGHLMKRDAVGSVGMHSYLINHNRMNTGGLSTPLHANTWRNDVAYNSIPDPIYDGDPGSMYFSFVPTEVVYPTFDLGNWVLNIGGDNCPNY